MTYAQGYKAALEAAAKLAHDYHFVLPMYESREMNDASDDAAESVCEQIADAIRALPVPNDAVQAAQWRPIETAPKGGGADRVDDPAWIEPPIILLLFSNGQMAVGRWDWYYAEGGRGCTDGMAWVDNAGGELLSLYYDAPTHWMPLPGKPVPEDAGDMVLVPREPTRAMQAAMWREVSSGHSVTEVYRAMIEAKE